MSKKHISFSQLVDTYAESGYGWSDQESVESALQHLIADKQLFHTQVLVEFLRRWNAICDALATVRPKKPDRSLTIDDSCPKFETKKVGDYLYGGGDLSEGIIRYVIIAKDDEGHCLVVECDDFRLDYPPAVRVAGDWLFSTLEDAVLHSAEFDLRYHGPRTSFASDAIKTVADDGDLSRFLVGMENLKDEEDEDE